MSLISPPAQTCCFTGHRGIDPAALAPLVAREIARAASRGYTRFISGMAVGFDLLCARVVLKYKDTGAPVALECALPCEGQTRFWGARERALYETVLRRADRVTVLSPVYTPSCMALRNRYMVDSSTLVIARTDGRQSGGTFQTLEYARSLEREIIFIE